MSHHQNICHHEKKWYLEKLYVVLIFIALVYLVSFVLNIYNLKLLNPLILSINSYIKLIWIPILLGLFIGGFIDYFIPNEYISKYLAQKNKSTIFYSVLLGFLMSGCSHGILAIAIELYKKGASIPSVIAFLLSSPWANLTITILLFGFFGIKAFYLVFSAIIIAIITGFAYQLLEKNNLIEKNKYSIETSENFSILSDIKIRMKNYRLSLENVKHDISGVLKGTWSLTKMVLWWVLIGMFIASLLGTYLPHGIFMDYLGPSIFGLIITLAIATVIEICSEGSSPLAFEIFKHTGAFGNSFVFLMAGVATDYTEIGLIWANIGRKTAIWLPIITVPQILVLGYIFNQFVK